MLLQQVIEIGVGHLDVLRDVRNQPLQDDGSLLHFGWNLNDPFPFHKRVQHALFPIRPFHVHGVMLPEIAPLWGAPAIRKPIAYTSCNRQSNQIDVSWDATQWERKGAPN